MRLDPLLLPLLLLLASPATAADWPQFHGPDRNNISPDTGLLKKWPAAGPRLVRTFTGLGGGYSSPAIVGDRLYISGSTKDRRLKLHCFKLDGKALWTADNGALYRGRFPGSRATPTVADGRVYLMSCAGYLGCHSADTGKTIWAVDFKKAFGARPPMFGYAEAVLVHEDKVICSPGVAGAWVVALDRKTGKILWKNAGTRVKENIPGPGSRIDPGYCASVLFRHEGALQLGVITSTCALGLDPKTGKELWNLPHYFRCPATPLVYHEGRLFATCGYGKGSVLFRLVKTKDGYAAKTLWTEYNLDNHHGGVVLVKGHLYGANDKGFKAPERQRGRRPRGQRTPVPKGTRPKSWVCLDFNTGKTRYIAKGVGKGSLTYADGMLYCMAERGGVVALVKADPAGYKEVSRFKLPTTTRDWSWAHPVVLDGHLYLRHGEDLFVYDVKKRRRTL